MSTKEIDAVASALKSADALEADLKAVLQTENGFLADVVLAQLDSLHSIQTKLSRAKLHLEP